MRSRRRRRQRAPLVYLVFDILHFNGWSLVDVPLIERKRFLREVLRRRTERSGVPVLQFSEHLEGNAKDVLTQLLSIGYEGIVSKRADSKYRSGRTGAWLKIKGRHHHRPDS